MTPEQTTMFKLQDTCIPGQPTPSYQTGPQEPEVDEVNQGLAQTVQYMAQNGPVRPIQRGRAKTMTMNQYKEQMMNQERGLPANLDEASRVVALEQKIQAVDSKLDQILSAIRPPRMSELNPPIAPPPTPPERPVVEQPEPVDCKARTVQPGQLRYHHPLLTDGPQTEIPILEAHVLQPVTFPQPSPQPASQETVQQTSPVFPEIAPPTDDFVEDDFIEMCTESGMARVPKDIIASYVGEAPTPPVSLGPVGSQGPDPASDDVFLGEDLAVERPLSPEQDQLLDGIIQNGVSSPSENIGIDALIEEDGTPVVDPIEEKRLERQQILADQVSTWLAAKNPHSFWKRFLGSACNKNLSYNTWPPEFQASFDVRFQQMIGDPAFISTLCGRIVKMQNGHMVAPNVAGAFIVVIAGMLSFALLEG